MQAIVKTLIMAAMCAKVVAAGARGAVGRVANTHQRIINNHHVLFRSGQHTTRALGSNTLAFTTLSSSSSQRINNHVSSRENQQQSTTLPFFHQQHQRRHRSSTQVNEADSGEFFANPETNPDFASLGITSQRLLDRLSSPPLGLKRPSAVQAAVFDTISQGETDVIVGAETGSGKTLAYLLPLVEDILQRKRQWKEKMDAGENEMSDGVMDPGYEYARAIVLVPNKELAHQAARMAASISGGLDRCVIWGADALGIDFNQASSSGEEVPEEEIVRLAILPGGLSGPMDFPPFRYATSSTSGQPRQSPPDIVFTTPANLGPMALSPKHVDLFADVGTLVVDEADMLLDGGYIRQLNNALMGFRRADRLVKKYDSMSFRRKSDSEEDVDKSDSEEYVDEDGWFDGAKEFEENNTKQQKKTQHVFVAATLPDYGTRSVDAYINKKFPNATNIIMAGMHNARHYGLESESRTIWNEIYDNQDRMQHLVDILRLDRREVGVDGRGLKDEKVMVFLNTVKDVDGATNGLRRAGINAVPYHAKIPLSDRTESLDRFRRYRAPTGDDGDATNNAKDAIPVLVCTDVASRGLDIPGVTAIVQLQFALNVVSHLHRMGRCGRAGNRDGRGVIFYGPKERELVEVVRAAEEQQSKMTLKQDVEDEDEMGANVGKGKVEKAFSRKRGFTKKRKKQRKRALESAEGAMEYD